MKIFIISLTVLSLLILGITLNAIHICNTMDLMIAAAEDMPFEPAPGAAAELSQLWDDHKMVLNITVSHIETDTFTLSFGDLLASIAADDKSSYLSARGEILILLHDIKHSESLALDRIF